MLTKLMQKDKNVGMCGATGKPCAGQQVNYFFPFNHRSFKATGKIFFFKYDGDLIYMVIFYTLFRDIVSLSPMNRSI
jgi:hypothetical protein